MLHWVLGHIGLGLTLEIIYESFCYLVNVRISLSNFFLTSENENSRKWTLPSLEGIAPVDGTCFVSDLFI